MSALITTQPGRKWGFDGKGCSYWWLISLRISILVSQSGFCTGELSRIVHILNSDQNYRLLSLNFPHRFSWSRGFRTFDSVLGRENPPIAHHHILFACLITHTHTQPTTNKSCEGSRSDITRSEKFPAPSETVKVESQVGGVWGKPSPSRALSHRGGSPKK